MEWAHRQIGDLVLFYPFVGDVFPGDMASSEDICVQCYFSSLNIVLSLKDCPVQLQLKDQEAKAGIAELLNLPTHSKCFNSKLSRQNGHFPYMMRCSVSVFKSQ